MGDSRRDLTASTSMIRSHTYEQRINPFNFSYVNEAERVGTWTEQLYYAAGTSSEFSQIMIILFVSAWCIWPVNWSMYYRIFELKVFGRDKVGIRSELLFHIFFGLLWPGIILPAAGTYTGRDAFVWIKVYSLVLAVNVIGFHKYVAGYPHRSKLMGWLMSVTLHGILWLNIMEAAIWELAVIYPEGGVGGGAGGFNIINGLCGLLNANTVWVYTYMYGVGVWESRGGVERHMRFNLPFSFVMAYTFWNAEYNANYHPEKAVYYIWVTLAVPLLGAILGHVDWLEIRAHILLHGLTLRMLPWGGNGAIIAAVGLGQTVVESPAFRWTFTLIGVAFQIFAMVEAYFIVFKGGKAYRWGLHPRAFELANRHPDESVKVPLEMLQGKFKKEMHHIVVGMGHLRPRHHRRHKHSHLDDVESASVAAENPEFQVATTAGA